MPEPLSRSPSRGSSDLYEPDDPEFLQTLLHMKLPGDALTPPALNPSIATGKAAESEPVIDIPEVRNARKRPRSPSPFDHDPTDTQEIEQELSGDDSDTYGASRFGGWGEYMRRKRAKLQIQNTQRAQTDSTTTSSRTIFRGVAIYINGWTEPSVQDLRRLILQHGGIFHAYLDKKSLVTHIITRSLTPAKVQEFKHMKVVKPEWLVESVKAGELLPWQDFIFHPGDRMEDHQGKTTAQKTLPFPARKSELHIPPPVVAKAMSEETPQPPEASPSHSKSPVVPLPAASIPGYAAHASNPIAKLAMANPEWRSAHTSAAPDFIEGYYKNSRLHYLSMWKAELKELVAEAQERAESGLTSHLFSTNTITTTLRGDHSDRNNTAPGTGTGNVSMKGTEFSIKSPKSKAKSKAKSDHERVVMHCDFDCFFVSAGLVGRPHLRGKPVVVCHSQGSQGGSSSTSEIASSSYEARKFGIKNGMSLQQARKLCPTVMTIPYEFELYKQFSLKFYTILMSHADDLQAVSVDEALIDVTTSVEELRAQISEQGVTADPAKKLADAIRDQVRKATGCEVSIGIAHNILLARIATRQAKPAGSYHLLPSDVQKTLEPLDISDLHGFGHSTRQKASEKLGATKLGELATKSKSVLSDALGKATGETLYNAIRGIDDRKLESDKPRKSVSCDITYGIRFDDNERAQTFVFQLAEEVARRLDDVNMRGRSVILKVMKRDPNAPVEGPKFLGHGSCETFNKQMALTGPGGRATSDGKVIGEHVWGMLKSFNIDAKDLRGIGIQVQKLESSNSTSTIPGQARLPFKSADSPTKEKQADPPSLEILVHPPSSGSDGIEIIEPKQVGPSKPSAVNLDLPSFSQVDKDVLNALPDDVRKELEAEYKRRSTSPLPLQKPIFNKPRSRLTVKGIMPKTDYGTLKRITRQLAPRNRPVMRSPGKNRLFAKRGESPAVQVSEAQLRKLDIDPDVFAFLPEDVQREQLTMARQAKAQGVPVSKLAERKVLKAWKPRRRPVFRLPPPQAKYIQPPFLKQRGKEKGSKLYFTEAPDVQRVIGGWVEGFREHPPNDRDVDFFAKFLLESVDGEKSSDVGIEKAVIVMKWWLVLLRRYWGVWENDDEEPEIRVGDNRVTSEMIGKTWWRAFRSVKEKIDLAIRKKFGGQLSLR